MKLYAGIGSRATPRKVCHRMTSIALWLNSKGFTLRSGGAAGADSAFGLCSHPKEIFLASDCTAEAQELSKDFHLNWDACGEFARKLHGRNAMILLGESLDTPVDFVVCWTPNGEVVGGTGQALRIAEAYNITVFNLFDEENYRRLYNHVRKNLFR